MRLASITMPYATDSDPGTAAGPDALLRAGLLDRLREQGHDVTGPFHATLRPEDEAAYGAWNRIGLANAQLACRVSETVSSGALPILLESNCYGAIGVLAGLSMSAGPKPLRLGMIWIDAHADFNTPETTSSGMLSGMPVAIATGLCLERLRRQSGLEVPIAPEDVVMVCVRANDPLEQEMLDRSAIEVVPVADIRSGCEQLRAALDRSSRRVDAIYVHLDVDALDETEVPSMWLTASNGPTLGELSAALEMVMAEPKVAAFGIADINPERDFEGQMIQTALSLLEAGIRGRARA